MKSRVIVLCLAVLSLSAQGSEQWDRQYAFKSIIPVVIADKKEELYRKETEKAIAAAIRQNPRFSYSDRALLALQPALKNVLSTKIGMPTADNTVFLQPLYKEMEKWQVDSAIIVEIQILNQDTARLSGFLVNTSNGYIMHVVQAPIANRRYIQHYADASKFIVGELSARIPFQANIASRDKFRVILDQGYNKFHKGQKLNVVTLEMVEGKGLEFVETGIIVVTQAERDITFAKILVENHPLEVAQANKIRAESHDQTALANPQAFSRAPASDIPSTVVTSAAEIGTHRPKYGIATASLAPTSLAVTNIFEDGTERSGAGMMLAAIKLEGELWITANLFTNLSLFFGSGSVSATDSTSTTATDSTSLGARYTEMRGWGGYRHYFGHPDTEPSVYFKAGLSKQSLSFSGTTNDVVLTNLSHSGLFVGAGGKYPLAPIYGIEVDLMTNLFSGFEESPVTSGEEVTGVANWEMSLRGYYKINSQFDASAKLFFNHSSAKFTGTGTRATPATTVGQTSTGVLLGGSYRF